LGLLAAGTASARRAETIVGARIAISNIFADTSTANAIRPFTGLALRACGSTHGHGVRHACDSEDNVLNANTGSESIPANTGFRNAPGIIRGNQSFVSTISALGVLASSTATISNETSITALTSSTGPVGFGSALSGLEGNTINTGCSTGNAAFLCSSVMELRLARADFAVDSRMSIQVSVGLVGA
jgi:hypothetical protein